MHWNGKIEKLAEACVIAYLIGLGCWRLVENSAAPSQIRTDIRLSLPLHLPLSLPLHREHCTNSPSGREWRTFKSMVEALNSLDAKYTISSGTVLSWYRDCSLKGNNDLDFAVDITWFTDNFVRLNATLYADGWHQRRLFGKVGQLGFEQSWQKGGFLKVDLFSKAELNSTVSIHGFTIGRRTYPCFSIQSSQFVQRWGNVSFPVPAPIEPYLSAMYSSRWMVKDKRGWRSAREAFKTADGRYCCFREPMPELSNNTVSRI